MQAYVQIHTLTFQKQLRENYSTRFKYIYSEQSNSEHNCVFLF